MAEANLTYRKLSEKNSVVWYDESITVSRQILLCPWLILQSSFAMLMTPFSKAAVMLILYCEALRLEEALNEMVNSEKIRLGNDELKLFHE